MDIGTTPINITIFTTMIPWAHLLIFCTPAISMTAPKIITTISSTLE